MSRVTHTKLNRQWELKEQRLAVISESKGEQEPKYAADDFKKREAVLAPTARRHFMIHPKLKPVLLAPGQSVNIRKEAKRQGLSDAQIKSLGIK